VAGKTSRINKSKSSTDHASPMRAPSHWHAVAIRPKGESLVQRRTPIAPGGMQHFRDLHLCVQASR
jgi:hypothetical protein